MQKPPPTSERIGPYRVLHELSGAATVSVLLAREDDASGFARNVVLKVVSPAALGDERRSAAWIAEATACAKLSHPAILRTRRVFRHEGALVLAVEQVDGVSLAELRASSVAPGARHFSDDAALQIGLSVCEALSHAHAAADPSGSGGPIVHGAVTPACVLIGRDGSVKLDGFGFAARARGVGGLMDDAAGALAYLAPEQISEDPTPKADVHAAGLILWELLTGRTATPLPRETTADAVLRAVAARTVASLADLRPDLPAVLTAAIDAALEAKPTDRNIGCAEMGRWIRKIFHFASAKLELRERVTAALAHKPAHGESRTSSPQASSSAKVVLPSAAAARAADASSSSPSTRSRPAGRAGDHGSHHRTLVGIAPPPAAAPPTAAHREPVAPSGGDERPALTERPSGPHSADIALTSDFRSSASNPPEPDESAAPIPVRTSRWPALSARLNAPTPWRRGPLITAWIGMALGLGWMVGKLAATRHSPESIVAIRTGRSSPVAAPAPLTAPMAAAAPAATAQKPAAEPTAAATPSPSALAAAAAISPAESAGDVQPEPETPPPALRAAPIVDESARKALIQRGLGYLTVHSTAPSASVYINLRPYGRVEEKLAVPCGKQFVSVGIPARRPGEPVWLAPGKSMIIACGGEDEATMNPRPLR